MSSNRTLNVEKFQFRGLHLNIAKVPQAIVAGAGFLVVLIPLPTLARTIKWFKREMRK